MKTALLFAAISLALSVIVVADDNSRNIDLNRRDFGGINNSNNRFGQRGNNQKNGKKRGVKKGAANSTSTAAGSASTATSNSTSAATGTASNTTSTNTGASSSTAASNSTSAATGTASNATSTTAGANNTNTGAAAGANNTNAGAATGNPQTSLTLDPKVIAAGFANNGQNVPTAGQVASLTSTNNFINFCLTVPNLPITNGKQIATGSCNPAPMGVIPSSNNMPSSKFTFPKNGDTSLVANTAFTISMAITNFQPGAFVNAQTNYFSAPQQLNAQGQIVGHSHVVVETLSALDQTTPTDPKKFAFFKGLNNAAVNGFLTADVSAGLPAGFYKLSSINTAANHQPVLVPIAQHGSLDDAVYFTIKANAAAAAAPPAASAAASAAPPAASAAPAAPPVASALATKVGSNTQSAAPVAASQATKGKQSKRFHSRAVN